MKRKGIITSLLLAFSISVFTPKIAKADEIVSSKLPNIWGKSALTMDYDTGEIIYYKDGDTKKYPASTTKLMTALVFAENGKKSELIPYTAEAKKQPEYSLNINFKPIDIGATMEADDVMKALLMYSANDSAYMIADYIGQGDYNKFVDKMNDKVKKLDLTNTHFTNPNGLHNADHYTTAYDLAVITQTAYKNDWVREVMGTEKSTIKISNGTVIDTVIDIENRNKNLNKDGNIGGKTGYTSEAGRCLATVYEKNGRKLVGVVLQSQYDANDQTVFEDMNKIMDWSFAAKKVNYLKAGTVVEKITVNYKPLKFFGPSKTIEVPLVLEDNVDYYENEVNKKELKSSVSTSDLDAWKLAKNKTSAKLVVSERSYEKEYNLKADITKSSLIKANIGIYFIFVLAVIILIVLSILLVSLIKRGSRRRTRRKNIF
ncbi:D-alanyl-D-alanine carboxypeptidase [Clostridium polyendosporum]|uniref:D-alanyl-D-alanine carboxypeptidase n=1 Tax=Clostridium polyendosporum TaxID=69208 RepID=A0A919S2W8_9CLOT|nr:D-alanyl-D-alanine carboxypeptidase family protein [Clostridium polyendosporum]GIM30484.1 D-alanyl-D-alanine carboxypeptidase [Clostridium polyendosporum]